MKAIKFPDNRSLTIIDYTVINGLCILKNEDDVAKLTAHLDAGGVEYSLIDYTEDVAAEVVANNLKDEQAPIIGAASSADLALGSGKLAAAIASKNKVK